MKGLIIKSPWIDLILEGKKVWEIRSRNTNIRGEIALIRSGSGTIIGTVELTDCKKLAQSDFKINYAKHCINTDSELPYKNVYAWVLQNAVLYEKPIPYIHPKGAIIWVNLDI